MKVSEIYTISPNEKGWRVLPNGNRVNLGNGVSLGDRVSLGDGVNLGDWVSLGNGVSLGDGVTSEQLNLDAVGLYNRQSSWLLTKWVTKERMSPNFDGGVPLHYSLGSVVEAGSNAVVSDRQCAPGLHVMRYGQRPEWWGLCDANHDLIKIDVEVL